MKTLIFKLFLGAKLFANEATETITSLFLPNQFSPDRENWVQLSPFGDFPNVDGKGRRVIQRFRREDAQAICDGFNSVGRKVTQPLGMPFYVGHPDHPRFRGQPGHTDTAAKGRGKEMAVRHAHNCTGCAAFGNTGEPCTEHGLFVRMAWNPDGEHLIANEAFHGHSVNWLAVPDGADDGVAVFRPTRVKSAGFTNEPVIPVAPATLANEDTKDDEASSPQAIVPPKLKLIAGFKEDDDVTMEDIIAALEKARPDSVANEDAAELARQFAGERRARAILIVDDAVKGGRLPVGQRDDTIEMLANAGEAFDAKAAELANAGPVIKTGARSANLAGRHSRIENDMRGRQQMMETLIARRAAEFPNEDFTARFAAVAVSAEGSELFARMKRSGAEE